MLALLIGCILTAASWAAAWGRFGVLTELSFFPLWLGYILTLNGVSEIVAGTSLLSRMGWSFGWLFGISVPFWWFFEGMNDIVRNWHYQFPHPISSTQYFLQASIDFSTVVPAAMSASFLSFKIVQRFSIIDAAPPAFPTTPRRARGTVKDSQLAVASLIGTLSFSLLALFPGEAFPLVWIAPLLIIEPIACAIGYPSLLRDMERHDRALIVSIMIGTLFTGLWWELWNYYSLPKWTYTVPYVGFWKIFEMPLIGYLGYPFFGLVIFGYTGIMLILISGKRLDDMFRHGP
jgi:hypothetical protein